MAKIEADETKIPIIRHIVAPSFGGDLFGEASPR
jgi:hypothetical protein